MATYLLDNFTGADGTNLTAHSLDIGGSWTVSSGSFNLQSNRANSSNAGGGIAVAEAGATQVRITCTLNGNGSATGTTFGLLCRYIDSNGHWRVVVEPNLSTLYIIEVNSGSVAVRVTMPTGMNNAAIDKVLTVVVTSTSITATLNGVTASYNSTLHNTATKCGIRAGDLNRRFDDFLVQSPTDDVAATSLSAYQIIQQDRSSGRADIRWSGTYTGAPTFLKGGWAGAALRSIATSPAAGVYSATIPRQAAGQGSLIVQFGNDAAVTSSIANVGIGDILLPAGQSNFSGRATNLQVYSHATLKAGLYGNDYAWKQLADPFDSGVGQLDAVSNDAASNPAGSVIPIIATHYMADRGIPVGFIPCAKGSSSITDWLPGSNDLDRTTLFGSMCYRALAAGGAALVLWWQGETDASNGMSRATYAGHLNTICTRVGLVLGIKVLIGRLQYTSVPDANTNVIRGGQNDVIASNAWAAAGPDLGFIRTTNPPDSDTFHVIADATVAAAGLAWAQAILAALPVPGSGGGTTISRRLSYPRRSR